MPTDFWWPYDVAIELRHQFERLAPHLGIARRHWPSINTIHQVVRRVWRPAAANYNWPISRTSVYSGRDGTVIMFDWRFRRGEPKIETIYRRIPSLPNSVITMEVNPDQKFF